MQLTQLPLPELAYGHYANTNAAAEAIRCLNCAAAKGDTTDPATIADHHQHLTPAKLTDRMRVTLRTRADLPQPHVGIPHVGRGNPFGRRPSPAHTQVRSGSSKSISLPSLPDELPGS